MPGTPSIKPLLGYPTKFGNKEITCIDISGPPSYGNIGTSSGTGQVINATDLGMGGFDAIISIGPGGYLDGYSQTGNYVVKVMTSASGTTPVATALTSGAALPKVVLQWFTTSAAYGAISTEVTNTTDLTAETLRMFIVGE